MRNRTIAYYQMACMSKAVCIYMVCSPCVIPSPYNVYSVRSPHFIPSPCFMPSPTVFKVSPGAHFSYE